MTDPKVQQLKARLAEIDDLKSRLHHAALACVGRGAGEQRQTFEHIQNDLEGYGVYISEAEARKDY